MSAEASLTTSPITQTYLARTRASAQAYHRAISVLPGGNTRQTAFWKPYPISIERATGHELRDVDGNRYIDLNNNYTALVHGHAYPPVVHAVREQIERGSCWAAGSLMNLHLSDRSSSPLARRGTGRLMSLLHLAALNRGVFMAPRGLIVLSTVTSEAVISEVVDRMKAAMQDVSDEL